MTWPFHFAAEDGVQGVLLALEDDGLAAEAVAFLAADLGDGAAGGEVAVEDDEVAVLLDRIVERADDLLAFRIGFHFARGSPPSSCR